MTGRGRGHISLVLTDREAAGWDLVAQVDRAPGFTGRAWRMGFSAERSRRE